MFSLGLKIQFNNTVIELDISYGGAYYAIINVKFVGIEFGKTSWTEVKKIAAQIKSAFTFSPTLLF